MLNRDVLATFPCRVRRRSQVFAASLRQPSNQRLRSFDRCRSLSDYRRANARYDSAAHLADLS